MLKIDLRTVWVGLALLTMPPLAYAGKAELPTYYPAPDGQ